MIRNTYRPNTLQMALAGLMMAARPINYEGTNAPRGRTDGTRKKKTVQVQGRHFVPRNISGVTPAQYRHQHMRNPEKALYQDTKERKRKWISA